MLVALFPSANQELLSVINQQSTAKARGDRMAPPLCEIRFDNSSQGVYHGGQTVSGSVELRLEKPKLVNAFRLVVSGYAEVEWDERIDNDRNETYTGKEELMYTETKLIPQSIGQTEIPAGVHVYNFASVIPFNVPTSFEGEHGQIRYTVRAILDRPWKFDHTYTAAFTVIKPLDLNQHDQSLKFRKQKKKVKTFCCWPCASDPLYLEVEIPMSGYVPGQNIPITISLNNTSSTAVTEIKSSLERMASYISTSPSQKTRVVGRTMASDTTAVTNDEPTTYSHNLEIPSIPPTGKCSVLILDYILKVKARVDDGCHRSPIIKIPITIGTIPFIQSKVKTMATTSTAAPRLNIGWIDELTPAPTPTAPLLSPSDPDMWELPPPSYEEAMHGTAINVNEPNTVGFQAFIPRYPVYSFHSDALNNGSSKK